MWAEGKTDPPLASPLPDSRFQTPNFQVGLSTLQGKSTAMQKSDNAASAALVQEDLAIQAWYLHPAPESSRRDIAAAAYQDAVEYLRKEFVGKKTELGWIEGRKSLDDIRNEARELETRYTAADPGKKTVLESMRKISSWILFYGQVLDVLSQHHPEYLALAWGSVKFILMGVLNHEAITSQITQALGDISDVMPRMELHAKLYPTDRMQESMARLYANLILFLRQVVKWFSRNSVQRALSAIVQPFELKYKVLVDGIRSCTKAIDEEASASSRAEIRGLHIEVRKTAECIVHLDQKMDRNHDAHGKRLDVVDGKLDDIHVQIKQISHRVTDVQGTVRDTRTRVIDLQLNEVINNLKPKTLPEETFHRQKSLLRRGSPWLDDNKMTVDMIQRLGDWICAPATPLLILQAGPRAKANAKELAMELIDMLEPSKLAVVWHLSDASDIEDTFSRADVLRSLVFQTMRGAQNLIGDKLESLDAAKFQSLHTEGEWLDLLSLILCQLPKCFMLAEAEEGAESLLLSMLETVIGRVQSSGCALKVLLLAGNTDLSSAITLGEQTAVFTVQKPTPPPAHLRRPRTRQNPRTLAWAGVKKRLEG